MPYASQGSTARRTVGSGFGEFFRYHGWLAPGVRLFRRIGFPFKALLVAAAFVVPLTMALAFVWSSTQAQIASTRSERQGLSLVRPVLDLVKAAQNLSLIHI